MGAPRVIGISGGPRDREVTSALLRTVLDGEHPYGSAGLIGGTELYNGVEWSRHPSMPRELARIDAHLENAQSSGLEYLVVELDPGTGAPTEPRVDVLCCVGTGGAGTVRATGGEALSFSSRGSLADVGASHVETHYGYIQFLAHTPSRSIRLALPMTGRFNLGPGLAVVAICELLGLEAGQIGLGMLGTRASGHGELIVSPDRIACALVEGSPEPRDGELLVAAAREDYASMRVEAVHGAEAVEAAVARAYARREGTPTMLVLLDAPGDRLEDAFQAATRRFARVS